MRRMLAYCLAVAASVLLIQGMAGHDPFAGSPLPIVPQVLATLGVLLAVLSYRFDVYGFRAPRFSYLLMTPWVLGVAAYQGQLITRADLDAHAHMLGALWLGLLVLQLAVSHAAKNTRRTPPGNPTTTVLLCTLAVLAAIPGMKSIFTPEFIHQGITATVILGYTCMLVVFAAANLALRVTRGHVLLSALVIVVIVLGLCAVAMTLTGPVWFIIAVLTCLACAWFVLRLVKNIFIGQTHAPR